MQRNLLTCVDRSVMGRALFRRLLTFNPRTTSAASPNISNRRSFWKKPMLNNTNSEAEGIFSTRNVVGAILIVAGWLRYRFGHHPRILIKPSRRTFADMTEFAGAADSESVIPRNLINLVVRRTAPSVVYIENKRRIESQHCPLTGSGFIARSDGLILTGASVVSGNSTVIVHLSNGRKLTGIIQSVDPEIGLASVKVSECDLPTLKLAESNTVGKKRGVLATGLTSSGILNTRFVLHGKIRHNLQMEENKLYKESPGQTRDHRKDWQNKQGMKEETTKYGELPDNQKHGVMIVTARHARIDPCNKQMEIRHENKDSTKASTQNGSSIVDEESISHNTQLLARNTLGEPYNQRTLVEGNFKLDWNMTGGPLLNMDGDVMGIIADWGVTSEGIRAVSAISLQDVKDFLENEASKPSLGKRFGSQSRW